MTSSTTAADFSRARFAQHPDGRIAARTHRRRGRPGLFDAWSVPGECFEFSDHEMVVKGWHPVIPSPDPSDPDVIEQAAERAREARYAGVPHGRWDLLHGTEKDHWRRVARAVLTPPPARDPEAVKLEAMLRESGDAGFTPRISDTNVRELADYLVSLGVRVGGGEDA